MRKLGIAAVVLWACAAPAAAQEKGYLLTGNNRTSFTWQVNDGTGFRWDISYQGTVGNGSNAYSGAMTLTVNGSSFSWGSEGLLSEDRREAQVGPWSNGSLRVWRRMYVPAKGGYCRWIDVFENTGGGSFPAKVRYTTYMSNSIRFFQSTSGKEQLAADDWGFATDDQGGSSRPAVCHFFADKGSKTMPRVTAAKNNNTVQYEFDLNVPAGKTVALCLFESQQRSMSDAQAFLKKFRPGAELRSLSADLRKAIVNIRGMSLALGGLELPRDEKNDMAVLRNGNELLGTIQDAQFVVETFYGKLELPAERVVGLAVPSENDSFVLVALADGQVVAGKLLSEPLKLKLESGSEMALPASKISTLSFRVSPQKPERIALDKPTLFLRSGQQVYYDAADVDYTFLAESGSIRLRAEDLCALHMDTPEGGLHRAVFRNGSVLAGLLMQKDLKVKLQLGPALSVPASSVGQFVFPGEAGSAQGLAEVTTKNEDVLYGRVNQDSLSIKTRYGPVNVARADLAELKLVEGTPDRVELKLHSGTTVTGQYVGEAIKFKVEPGPEISLSIGHVVQITCPKPVDTSSTHPATAPSAASAAPAARSPEDDARIAKLDALERARQDMANQLAKVDADRQALLKAGRAEEAARMAAMAEALRKKMEQVAAEIEKAKAADSPAPSADGATNRDASEVDIRSRLRARRATANP